MRAFFARLKEKFLSRFDKINLVSTKEIQYQRWEGMKTNSRMIVGLFTTTRFSKVLKTETLYTANSSFPSYGWMFEDGTNAGNEYSDAYRIYAANKTSEEEKERNLEIIEKAKKVINLAD
jgi:hypothetical protein